MQHEITGDIVKQAYGRAHPSPKEPCRTAKEVAELFGFASSVSLISSVNSGSFPQPDLVSGMAERTKKLYWKLSTIKKEQARRAKLDDKRINNG